MSHMLLLIVASDGCATAALIVEYDCICESCPTLQFETFLTSTFVYRAGGFVLGQR